MLHQLTTKYPYKTDTGNVLTVGDKVQYLGHIPGGWVQVRFADGKQDTVHPRCFEELQ